MLDVDEYLHLAIHAGSVRDHHACMSYLKQVLLQQPRHATAIFLLAVQHAELGLMVRALAGLKEAVTLDPRLEVAQFQLAWLLLNGGRPVEAKPEFAKLKASADETMRIYAEGMIALCDNDIELARARLSAGLATRNVNPGLASLMQHLLDRLASSPPATAAEPAQPAAKAAEGPIFLGAYARESK